MKINKISYLGLLYSVTGFAQASNDAGLGDLFLFIFIPFFTAFGCALLIIVCWGFYKSTGKLQYAITVICVLALSFISIYLKLYFAHE